MEDGVLPTLARFTGGQETRKTAFQVLGLKQRLSTIYYTIILYLFDLITSNSVIVIKILGQDAASLPSNNAKTKQFSYKKYVFNLY